MKVRQNGFTLLELVVVITLMGIIAVIGTRFIVQSVTIYDAQAYRAQLIAGARQATERMSRQLRSALPNSVRITGTGRCIEFVPVVGAASYFGQVSDAQNGAPLTTSITTTPFNLDASAIGPAAYVAIGLGSPTEVYSASPDSITPLGGLSPSTNTTTVTLSSPHQFQRNSISNRLFITASPQRFCVLGTSLRFYRSYGVTSGALSDSAPSGGVSELMLNDVNIGSETPFALTPGSQTQNAMISIVLPAEGGGERVVIRQKVLLRNVP